ncbi:helix-turn-helix domain-containing protein [Brevibacillus brevis]|uniref:helix-turn-helix domain-containing protein n=1 Tax=Brevibacillus brevis TaxID=1393 RepID=UPI00163CB1B5|nr:helix-turn-helix domain-containing protein [Lysinibacillus sp. SDF0063]
MSDVIVAMRGTIYESGYGLIAKKVMQDKTISIKAKALYAYLSSFAGSSENRSAFPGVSRMMEDLSVSKDSFYKYRKELEKSGYITIVQDKNSDGTFKNNIYYIEAVPCPKNQETDDPCPKKPDTVVPDTENQDNNNINLSKSNNSNKKEREREDNPNGLPPSDPPVEDINELELEYLTLQEMTKRIFGTRKAADVDVESVWNHWKNRFPQYSLIHMYGVLRATQITARPKDDVTGIIITRLPSAQTSLVPVKQVAMDYVAELKLQIKKGQAQ